MHSAQLGTSNMCSYYKGTYNKVLFYTMEINFSMLKNVLAYIILLLTFGYQIFKMGTLKL